MNSPSLALIWEIWRKNRWGFALLIVMLAVCMVLSRIVVHLRDEAARLESALPQVANMQSLPFLQEPPSEFSSTMGVVAHAVQIKLGSTVMYEGKVMPGDTIECSTPRGKSGWLRLKLGAKTLFEGPMPDKQVLHWSTDTGAKESSPIVFARHDTPEVIDAKAAAEIWRNAALGWCIAFMGFSFLVVFGIFGCAEPHTSRGFTGISPRHFTLPVRIGSLVAWPILLGTGTILLLYLVWSRFLLSPLLPSDVKMPDLYLALLLPAGLVVFQAIVWGFASLPKTRLCLITLFLLGLIPLGGWPFDGHSNESSRWFVYQAKLPTMFIVVWVMGAGSAWIGVRQERLGGWSGWKGPATLERLVQAVRPRPSEFRSALRAQFWIEWRRNARLALGVLVLLAVCAVGIAFLLVFDPPRFKAASVAVGPLAVLVIPVWLAIAGLNVARDGSSKRLAFSSFSATRPLSTGTLLTAKLLAAAALWTCAVLVFALVAVSLVVLDGDFRGLPNLIEWIVVVTVSGHLFVGILPLCLSGRIPGFPWSLLPLLLIYGLVVNALSYIGHHQEFYSLLFLLLVVLIVAKLAVAFWGFRRALGLKWISPRFVAGYVALWLMGSGVLVLLAQDSIARADWAPDMMPLLPAAALVLPLARIALSPLALAMNRHR